MATRTDKNQVLVEEEVDCLFCKKVKTSAPPPPTPLLNTAARKNSRKNTQGTGASAQSEPPAPVISFTKVKSTGKEIGRGAYGRVFEIECEKTRYAAKEMHALLLESAHSEGLEIIKNNFLRECQIWSMLHHPRIVEFIGIYYPPKNLHRLPVIIMEKMYFNLTNLVEKNNDFTYNKTITILNDVCLGLQYLHSRNPPIVHRDLTPNNILLCLHLRAKISDLGVARTLKSTDTNKAMTQAPGTPDFMAPECLVDNPVYTLALDIFAFGGVILYTTTRQWPHPAPWISFDSKTNEKLVNTSELQRRQKYLDKMPNAFIVFKPLVISCLDDNPINRPEVTKVLIEINKAKKTFTKKFSAYFDIWTDLDEDQKQKQQEDQLRQGQPQKQEKQVQQKIEQQNEQKKPESQCCMVQQEVKQQDEQQLTTGMQIQEQEYQQQIKPSGPTNTSNDDEREPQAPLLVVTANENEPKHVLYVAKFDFSIDQDQFLNFKEGDLFYMLHTLEGDWWYARAQSTGQEGYIPHSYVTKYGPDAKVSNHPLYVAKYDYSSAEDGYLSFKKGSLLYVLNTCTDKKDWWYAREKNTGNEGYIPPSYVTKHKPDPKVLNYPLYEAKYDYSSESDGYLSFKKGDLFSILNTDEEDWWYASDKNTGQEGYIPLNYVTIHEPPKLEEEVPNYPLYVAKYDYVSKGDQYLSFVKGDLFYVLNSVDGDWWLVRAKDSSQEGYIPNNFIVQANTLDAEEWFFGAISRKHAENLLMQPFNDPGSYLVRNSESIPSDYSLSVKFEKKVVHYKINHCCEGYSIFNLKPFESISKLVAHYQVKSHGLRINLKSACLITSPQTASCPSEEANETWEIDRSSIQLVKKLGAGKFGETWLGRWKTTKVAVKIFEQGVINRKEFFEEATLMKQIRHPKLIDIYAVCTKEEPVYIITEFMKHGSLMGYLRGDGRSLKLPQLLDVGAQVAAGMAYLEQKNYVHRHIAAKNILVSENLRCKVEIVSMARILSEDIYKPIKWTAPEALFLHCFTIKSDVWSFGIFLYELITYGSLPYPDMNNGEVLKKLKEGYRMPCPKGCPEQLYKIMRDCWRDNADTRPTFESLHWRMEDFFVENEPTHLYLHQVS